MSFIVSVDVFLYVCLCWPAVVTHVTLLKRCVLRHSLMIPSVIIYTVYVYCLPLPAHTRPVFSQSYTQRAFVIGRPPGHHAGPSGCVPSEYFWLRPDMTSSGFCLLNTVAVAAAYARYNYSMLPSPGTSISSSSSSSSLREVVPGERCVRGHPVGSRPLRVAIVDIDVHHGNGTEEIVKNLE